MTKEPSLLGQFFVGGNPSSAYREEKVLRYIIRRIDGDAALPEVLEVPYVRYILFGEGDTAPVIHEVLREAEPNIERRPITDVGGR
jgi:hypothetical protein